MKKSFTEQEVDELVKATLIKYKKTVCKRGYCEMAELDILNDTLSIWDDDFSLQPPWESILHDIYQALSINYSIKNRIDVYELNSIKELTAKFISRLAAANRMVPATRPVLPEDRRLELEL